MTWVARCRNGREWIDTDVGHLVGNGWPEALTDGRFVWERAAPRWPGAALPLRVVKDRVVLLYPYRRRVTCCDVVDVAEAMGWPLEKRRR